MKTLLSFFLMIVLAAPVMASPGKTVTYTVDGQSYEGYSISPMLKAPLVIVIHDWDGLTDYEVKRSQMLAELGYAVFSIDLFGAGVRPSSIAEKQNLTGTLYQNREKMRRLMNGALTAAKDLGLNTENAVVAGYCFGGAAVLEWARSGVPLKGFVTFHGGLTTPAGQDYSKATGKYLILHGTADTSVSMDDFAHLAKNLEEAGLDHEMVTYSGAPHAFTVFGSPRYHKAADMKSWQQFTNFLAGTLQ